MKRVKSAQAWQILLISTSQTCTIRTSMTNSADQHKSNAHNQHKHDTFCWSAQVKRAQSARAWHKHDNNIHVTCCMSCGLSMRLCMMGESLMTCSAKLGGSGSLGSLGFSPKIRSFESNNIENWHNNWSSTWAAASFQGFARAVVAWQPDSGPEYQHCRCLCAEKAIVWYRKAERV